MKMQAILCLVMFVAGLSHSEDGVLTTEYLTPSWWEWHSSKDLQDWPRYTIELGYSGLISGIIKYPRSADINLAAEWELINNSEILLGYIEYSGENLPVDEDSRIVYATRVRMQIRRLEDSVFHEYALYVSDWGDVPDLVLLGQDFTVRPNLRRTVNRVEVVTMGAVFGETTQNVRIRTAPGVQANIIRFLKPGAAVALDYCPKGTQIRILARTLQKERVQQWTNYWYCVEITDGEGMMQRYGWMFGEFVTFSEEMVREEEIAPRPWDLYEDLPASPESEETNPDMYEYD